MPNDVDAPDDGWRTALSESFDKVVASEAPIGAPAAPAETSSPVEPTEAAPSTESASEGRERDELGRFKPGAAAKGNEAPRPTSSGAQAGAASGAPSGAAAPQTAVPVAPPAPVLADLKPPQSWKPAVRELAAKLPAEFRPIIEEAVRRDREAAVAMQAKAEAEKGAGVWGEVVRPYEAQFRQAGVQPQQYVGDLLRTAHALTYGQPHQQMDVLADVILKFGHHLLKADSTNADGSPSSPLDRALVAKMQGQTTQPQQAPQAPIDPEAIVRQVEERMQATIQQRVAEAELVKVAPELEYIEDLKDDMAKVFEAGLASDYKEAYALALQLPKNADTLAIVRQKEAAKSAANAQASTQKAKAAASSVRSTPGGAGGSAPLGDDIRSHLEASWDRASGS